MSNKVLVKLVVASGVLAVLLTFLGLNYVPGISAASSVNENAVNAARNAGSDWIERHPSAVLSSMSLAGSDWIERHPSAVVSTMSLAGSDWIERHPSAVVSSMSLAGSDWIERHPSNFYDNSDWIGRHSGQRNP